MIEIAGVTTTDLTATGEVDLITGPVSSTKSGGGFNISGAYKNVMKRHKDVKSFKSEVTSLAESAGSAWWAGPLKAIKNLTDKSWFGALGPVAGFLEFVIGGGSRKSTLPAPLATKGSVQLKGTLTTEVTLYQLIMRAPGSNHLTPGIDAASNVLPLYDQLLGVFNVSRPPTFTGTVTTNRTEFIPTGPWSISSITSASTPLQIVYNTAVFANANVTVAWAPSYYPAYNYTTVSTFNSGQNRYFVGDASDEQLYVDLISGAYFSRIGIRARLTPHNAASGLEPVTLYKTYLTFTNTNLVYDSGNGGGSGGGGGGGGGGGLGGGGGIGDGDGCIICPGIVSSPDLYRATTDSLRSEQLHRPSVQATTLDEHITDYLLALLPEMQAHDEPGPALEAARRAYRDQLVLLGDDSESWTETDLRLLESLALRSLADRGRPAAKPLR